MVLAPTKRPTAVVASVVTTSGIDIVVDVSAVPLGPKSGVRSPPSAEGSCVSLLSDSAQAGHMVTVRVANMRGGEGSWIIATLMVVMGTCSRSVLQVVLKSVVVPRSGGAESLAPMLMLSAGGFTCEVVAELVPLALADESDVGPGAGGAVADEIGGRVLLDAGGGLSVCDGADVGCESGSVESLIGALDVAFGSGCGDDSGDNGEDPVDDISWTVLGKGG